jgi:hypothetical protein
MSQFANLTYTTSTGTGTGNLTLAGVTGWRTFEDAFGHGATADVFRYAIRHASADEWEIGTGHLSDATTLVRDTIIESSNSNAAVDFSAGTKHILNDADAAWLVVAAAPRYHMSGFALRQVQYFRILYVSGATSPVINGLWFEDGTYNGAPSWKRYDDSGLGTDYYLWWDNSTDWAISAAKGTKGDDYFKLTSTDPAGTYTANGDFTGTLIVADTYAGMASIAGTIAWRLDSASPECVQTGGAFEVPATGYSNVVFRLALARSAAAGAATDAVLQLAVFKWTAAAEPTLPVTTAALLTATLATGDTKTVQATATQTYAQAGLAAGDIFTPIIIARADLAGYTLDVDLSIRPFLEVSFT